MTRARAASIGFAVFLQGRLATYGEIVRELKRGEYGEFREWADYRVATDGAFVQRVVNIPPLSFCFRRLAEDANERCYAIQRRLS
jgi:hypothetical protein